ncbi:MAG TPA: hypothetical protein VGX78_21820, partial [Pirellulales bacterium]|nr:hypothetical protein [Pirellulales bacterium]
MKAVASAQRGLFDPSGEHSAPDRAAVDVLALTRDSFVAQALDAGLLAQLRLDGCGPEELFRAPASRLREHFRIRAESAEMLRRNTARLRREAAELYDRAGQLGIVVLLPGTPSYPARIDGFYDGAPPLLYAMGNLDLLSAQAFAVLNSGAPSAASLAYTFACASRLAEACKTLLASPENPSYNLVGLGGKLAAAHVVVVLHRGLLDMLAHGTRREPLPLARRVDDEVDLTRMLLVSPFRLDGRWQKGNGPRRDTLLAALAHTLVAVEVTAGGTIESL